MAYHLLLAWLASSSLFLQKLSLSLIEEDSGVLLFLQKFEFNFCILCFNTTGEVHSLLRDKLVLTKEL